MNEEKKGPYKHCKCQCHKTYNFWRTCCDRSDDCVDQKQGNFDEVAEESIQDGFGNTYPKYCDCGAEYQIVRPGKIQCSAECDYTKKRNASEGSQMATKVTNCQDIPDCSPNDTNAPSTKQSDLDELEERIMLRSEFYEKFSEKSHTLTIPSREYDCVHVRTVEIWKWIQQKLDEQKQDSRYYEGYYSALDKAIELCGGKDFEEAQFNYVENGVDYYTDGLHSANTSCLEQLASDSFWHGVNYIKSHLQQLKKESKC